MGEENKFRTCPLFGGGGDLCSLDLVFVEVWDLSDDDPGEGTTEVDAFVHYEGENARGEGVILHVCVPAL